MITSEEIKTRLWDGANELRGSMDASRYKDYMLGLMFYKFLSDKTLFTFRNLMKKSSLTEENLIEEYFEAMKIYKKDLVTTLQKTLGYYVAPKYLYQTWVNDINAGDFQLQKIIDSLNAFEKSISVEEKTKEFKGLFSNSTIDLSDTALGSDLHERSKNVKELIKLFADLDMVSLQKGDILGDAYEYLIGQFAMESGKKAGEFYTPRQVSEVMAQIVVKSSKIESIYDATVGSGSLLLTVGKHLNSEEQKNLNYYGQEKNTATYNLTRMNLLLHGVRPEKMTIRNADTLSYDWPEDPDKPNNGILFDAIVMNPPYSVKNWNKENLKASDPRFTISGILPPDGKGDYAFLLHGLYHLGTDGTMAIVLPHGVLFRGNAEYEIRKRLLEKNLIDTIIGLPEKLFTNTGIPVIIMILKKNRKLNEPVLIIDSSNNFFKVGKQNTLLEKDIAKIADTYESRNIEIGYSALATREEIIQNDFNMNIPRYVTRKEEEIEHDVEAHLLGGIPQKNIDNLQSLNSIAPEILHNEITSIRKGYVKINRNINDITQTILNSPEINKLSKKMKKGIKTYIEKYQDCLMHINDPDLIKPLMDNMLNDIKTLLAEFKYLNIYNGYQIIAEIWKNYLTQDLERISNIGIYKLAQTKEPNMRINNKKEKVQDGWVSSLIPTDLIIKQLYSKEKKEIENLENKLAEIESKIEEIVELAKVEESKENEVLYDCIKTNKDGELENSFLISSLREEKKEYSAKSEEWILIENIENLYKEKKQLSNTIKQKTEELKKLIENRIPNLTEQEIKSLVHEKWFGTLEDNMINLLHEPLKNELHILKILKERYENTLDELDKECINLEHSFKSLLDELEVTGK